MSDIDVTMLPPFPVPVMWHQNGRIMGGSESFENPYAEYFTKEQLIDYAIEFLRLQQSK